MKGKAALSLLAGLPLILPGIIIGLSLRALIIQFKLLPLYQSIWIFVLAYIPLVIPYSLRYVEPAMLDYPASRSRPVSAARSLEHFQQAGPSAAAAGLLDQLLGARLPLLDARVRRLEPLSSFGNQVVGPQLFETFESQDSGVTSAFVVIVALVGIVVAAAALLFTRRLFRVLPLRRYPSPDAWWRLTHNRNGRYMVTSSNDTRLECESTTRG